MLGGRSLKECSEPRSLEAFRSALPRVRLGWECYPCLQIGTWAGPVRFRQSFGFGYQLYKWAGWGGCLQLHALVAQVPSRVLGDRQCTEWQAWFHRDQKCLYGSPLVELTRPTSTSSSWRLDVSAERFRWGSGLLRHGYQRRATQSLTVEQVWCCLRPATIDWGEH